MTVTEHRWELIFASQRWGWLCSCGLELWDFDTVTDAELTALDHEAVS